MTLSSAEARRLLPYLVELPHETAGRAGLTNAAFRAANIPECRFVESPLDCGTGYVEQGAGKRWVQIVDRAAFEAHARKQEHNGEKHHGQTAGRTI